ncbi:MAG TPA: glycosyltransferase family 2 protein [Candidatus Paceibacterota bacterium]|nr:glycosyltransferase family 2 protein [Candidatus Paceibacterota bacterium]
MLSIITVNFNNAAATCRLVHSLESQTDHDFEVVIVDNASEADDRAILGEAIACSALNAQIYWSDVNGGFAAGTNLGIRLALSHGAQWIALINNDALASPDAIAMLKGSLTRMEPAVVALPLLERGRTVRAGIVRWLSTTLPHAFEVPPPDARIYAVGGGMAFHRDVHGRLGPLDERYFLYFEDADYSERARKAGIPVVIADISALSHEVSATTSRLGSPLLLRYHMRNALLFNAIHGPWWVRIALPGWSIFSMVKQLIKIAFLPSRRPQSHAIAAGILDFYAHRFGHITDRRHRV